MSKSKTNKASNKAPSLLKVLLFDIFVHHWMVTLLALLLVISAMTLAHTTHDSRRLLSHWQKLRHTHDSEQIVWDSLRLELTSLSEADRISNLAKSQLGMVDVKAHNEKVISL
jgi:cell division protein FtsL